jgi:hypothetical protein
MSRKIRPLKTAVKTALRAEQKSAQHSMSSLSRPRQIGLIIVRAAGGREQGAFSQVRALIVEANGDARLLALSHTRNTNIQSRARHHSSLRKVAA